MRHPPRFAHLCTVRVVAGRLRPVYAATHDVDDQEAQERLERALSGALRDRLLDAGWAALRARSRGPDGELLDKVAEALARRPLRPGRMPEVNPPWGAFLLLVDLEAGTAGPAARRAFESPHGMRMAEQGIEEAGRFLAAELARR